MEFRQDDKVRHRQDRGLGSGSVLLVRSVGGQQQVFVSWPSKPGSATLHAPEELERIVPLWEMLRPGEVGPASFTPFVLRVLRRWFEARHALTGELSNQPFQMLPHQVIVTSRVVNSAPDKRRWLIADDVGLGKTIEAGMIMEVLRKRTIGRFRCLLVTPAGLIEQWIEEMALRFGRLFTRFSTKAINDLETRDLLVGSIDTLKKKDVLQPMRGVSPWDLVIFDEAHHLATDSGVQKHKLARFLRDEELARDLIFLTATPHSGNTEYFFNMMRLLREDLFTSQEDVTRGDGRLNQVMIRNRKSDVTDTQGQRIFKGIAPAKILGCEPTPGEVEFYEGLLDYIRKGYNAADGMDRQKAGSGRAVGFVMTTFRKMASSSRAAIRSALEKRLCALGGEAGQGGSAEEEVDERFLGESEERRIASAAIETVPGSSGKGRRRSPIQDELGQVERLLRKLDRLEEPDSKLSFFLQEIARHLPPDVKVLIFTEYLGTQGALVAGLSDRFGKEAVTFIHGSMKLEDRRDRVTDFNERAPNPRFMVSTETGGEGLNMQKSCHVVVNYDLPWNPIRLQQRVGRVYRYGQTKTVQVYNVRLESQSDAFADVKIDEYLRAKIQEITRLLAEVQEGEPEDIEAEVVGQLALNVKVDKLYETAVREGEAKAREQIDQQTRQIEQIMKDPAGMLGLFKGLKHFDITSYEKASARVSSEQLAFFVEQYLARQGTPVRKDQQGLWSFAVPRRLVEIANKRTPDDSYEVRQVVREGRVERSTVDKELAAQTLSSRLLRFGDAVFDSIVRHVQQSDFSEGVTSLCVPALAVGWERNQRGVCALFDLKIMRQGGATEGTQVVRDEILAIGVARGGRAASVERLLDRLHEASEGPLDVDPVEVQRAYAQARGEAEHVLTRLREETASDLGSSQSLVAQIDDLALAWVEAV